jgi:hypothetical protein
VFPAGAIGRPRLSATSLKMLPEAEVHSAFAIWRPWFCTLSQNRLPVAEVVTRAPGLPSNGVLTIF